MAEADTNLANIATSLETLGAAITARLGDEMPAHQVFTECVEREVRRLNDEGQERIAGSIGSIRATGYRILKEGW